MNAETFCEQFATFAEAPDGVTKLRELILQLAVQGELVPQDVNDESAATLLKRIAIERQELIAHRGLRGASEDAISTDDPPSELPSTWSWTRLGNVMLFTNGFAFQSNDYQDDGVGIVRIGDIQNTEVVPSEMKCVPASFLTSLDARFRVNPGDLVIAMSGATTGKLGFNRTTETFLLNQRVGKLELLQIDPQFVFFYLATKIQENLRISAGSAIPNLSTEQIKTIWFPLPPLAEQRRIVAKVDQLLGLCDELAARQTARSEKRQQLVGATLDRLVSARSAAEFPAHAHRLKGHFDRLFDTPTTIPQLRQAILQLAVQGQLVPQDPKDEPASVTQGDADANDIEHVPFAVPTGWSWRLVSDVFDVSGGITKNPKRAPIKNHYPYLRVANVQRGRLKLEEIERFELCDGELERWRLEPGDVLVVEGNGSEDEIGRCALWNGEIADCVHQNHIIRCRPLIHDVQNFVLLFLNSPAGIAEMKERAITTSGL